MGKKGEGNDLTTCLDAVYMLCFLLSHTSNFFLHPRYHYQLMCLPHQYSGLPLKARKGEKVIHSLATFTGTPPSNDIPAGKYPFTVKSDDGRDVPVVQAYAFGKYLGYLNVVFDDEGKVIRASGNPILLNSSIPEGMYGKENFISCRLPIYNIDDYLI